MTFDIMLTEREIREAIATYIAEKVGIEIDAEKLPIETKSKWNYRATWEPAEIRVCVKAYQE